MTLTANLAHPRQPKMSTIRICHVTDPQALRVGFWRRDYDVIVVGGDEKQILDGSDSRIRDGQIYHGQSNFVSMLAAKPEGVLADESLRRTIAGALPRAEFAQKFLGAGGRAVWGFTPESRDTPQPVSDASHGRPSIAPSVVFVVPPSERTVSRANWLSQVIHDRTGVKLEVTVPSWKEYQSAVNDPHGGDLLWMGIGVDFDTPRQWVEDCLFGPWLPIPDSYLSLKEQINQSDAASEELVEAERALLADGWMMPLYHHYHTYLVRKGLRGLKLDPADWPIPGIQYAEDLSWS